MISHCFKNRLNKNQSILLSSESSNVDSSDYSADQESKCTPEIHISTGGTGAVQVTNIPKLVDNKRKHTEKGISQSQRDRFLISA